MRTNHKSLYFLLITGGLIIAAGCNKTIDKTPISTITAANFYKTASDAEAGLAGAYNGLYQQYYIWDYMTNVDAQSDNCYAGGNNPDNFSFFNFSLTPLYDNIPPDSPRPYFAIAHSYAVLPTVPPSHAPFLTASTT